MSFTVRPYASGLKEIDGAKMKRILFILPSLGVGGLERVLVTTVNLLASAGNHVTVLTFDQGQALAEELLPSVRFIYKPPKPHPVGKRLPYIRHKLYDDGLWETRATAKALYNYYVGKETYDVEIAFFRGRSVKIISGSSNPNSIKLAWVHNDYTVCGGVTANFKSEKALKKAYDAFHCVVAVSKLAAEKFRQRIASSVPVQTIYNPIPIEEIIRKAQMPCSRKKNCFTVVSVGRLVEAKGFDRLIEAFCNAEKLTGKRCELWIIGEGEKREQLSKQIEEHHSENVFLLGEQKNPFPFVAQADILVCASRFEGFNLTVAEGLVLGKPILSTKCTGPTEILDDGVYGIICENSTGGLESELVRIFSDSSLLRQYQSVAKERAKAFGESNALDAINKLIECYTTKQHGGVE